MLLSYVAERACLFGDERCLVFMTYMEVFRWLKHALFFSWEVVPWFDKPRVLLMIWPLFDAVYWLGDWCILGDTECWSFDKYGDLWQMFLLLNGTSPIP